ncbi:hypothetical protein AC579_4383 [Pseudocercospora musae]|uniref:Transcription factor domain-containing protein n=1 Tax=Pseudocercospora musae TaxID=113226 RepID=A0A139HN23_9PEZI|nr:hypothetical protein AC579_4383 [Pseudocercospora musae]
MQRPRDRRDPAPRSVSRSPLPSPGFERDDPIPRGPTTVAFVPFEAGTSSGVSIDTRRAVRVQAAKASAAARKRTIARKLAQKRTPAANPDGAGPSSTAEGSDRGRKTSSTSGAASDTLNPSRSQSPSRPLNTSLSTGDIHAAYRPYPVTKWHSKIPHIVEYFERYFLPENVTGLEPHGRAAMRTQLWSTALADTCLFNAIMLVSASHAITARAQSIPTQLLYQLKHTALECINDAVARADAISGIGDAVIASIALVGGWELEYSSVTTYDTHMGGLNAIVNNMRGGVGDQSTLPSAFKNIVLGAGHDLALFASKRPVFERPGAQAMPEADTLPRTLPIGFEELRAQRLVLPSLIHLASSLSMVTLHDPAFIRRVGETQQALVEWNLDSILVTSYCATRTIKEDFLVRQACLHIRLAALALCAYLRLAMGSVGHDVLQDVYDEALHLQWDALIGTVYEEVAFWALFTICFTTGHCESQHMRVLKRLQLEQDIEDWPVLREMLGRYVYPARLVDSRALALWDAVSSSTIARDPNVGLKQPSRYAKGIKHPTTAIGTAISAEEG